MVSIKTMVKRAVLCLATLSMAACTIVPYDQARPVGDSRQPTTPGLSESAVQEALIVPQQPATLSQVTETSKSLPAAQRIRQLASAEGDKGDYKRAIALLERALRISPRDPETYYELARIHLLMDEPAQALQLAQRGLSNKPSAEQREHLEQLIEDCRAKLTA